MKLKYILIFTIINLYSSILFSKNIAVVNIQSLIDNNSNYITILSDMEKNQQTYLDKFNNKENELKKMLNDIENSKLILSENEINLMIDEYNIELNNFSLSVEEFNFHYQNQIIKIRENLLKEIILLLEEYATLNQIDLILDSTSYLIASNSLDITEYINNKLNEIKLDLQYDKYEKN